VDQRVVAPAKFLCPPVQEEQQEVEEGVAVEEDLRTGQLAAV